MRTLPAQAFGLSPAKADRPVRRLRMFAPLSLSLLLMIFSPVAQAGFDNFDEREDTGIFSRQNQKALDAIVIGGMVGTALWQGTDTKLGRTSWQALDASLLTAGTTEVLKNVFQRPRPSENPNSDVWFAGHGNKSFPSGEAAFMAAFVTPYIYAYKDEQPAVWGLVALPVYMGYARMSSQAHWLSDILAGYAVGFELGYYATQRQQPLVLSITGQGVFVGWRTKF
jgi:undecaprenyl-diphosphatase